MVHECVTIKHRETSQTKTVNLIINYSCRTFLILPLFDGSRAVLQTFMSSFVLEDEKHVSYFILCDTFICPLYISHLHPLPTTQPLSILNLNWFRFCFKVVRVCCVKPVMKHISNTFWIVLLFSINLGNWRREITTQRLFRGFIVAWCTASVSPHVVRVRGAKARCLQTETYKWSCRGCGGED